MIKVSHLQRGNKLLDFLSTASWHYDSSTSADYEINFSTHVLFLSLKFHASKPEYIHKRVRRLRPAKLRILLVLLDTPSYNTVLEELFRTVHLTIVLCRSYDECARYLRGFDICSKRGSEVLRRKSPTIDHFLEAFPKITKSNSVALQGSFRNIQELFNCTEEGLSGVFGMGRSRAQSFIEHLRKPFKGPDIQ